MMAMQSSSAVITKIGPEAFLGNGGVEFGPGASLNTRTGFSLEAFPGNGLGQGAFPANGFGPEASPAGDPS